MKILSFLSCGTLLYVPLLSSAAQEERLNILWLFGEDISPWMPAYGDSTVVTPNIDYLAQNGVLFTNCFSTCSVSSPSRSAIITGCMQTTIGMHNHRTGRTPKLIYSLPEGVSVLPKIFKEHGYFTFNNGKDDFNWQYEWSEYWHGEATTHKFFGKTGQGSWSDCPDNKPFFGIVELYGGKNRKKVDNPVNPDIVPVPPYYPDLPFMRTQLAQHYDQIRITDAEIGELLQRMKNDGIDKNTIIVFMSDNGYQTLRDKQFLYDGGIHMPFIISCPGNPELLKEFGVVCGSVRDDMMSLLDVTATSLALAGISIPEYMESRNVLSHGYHRDYIVSARDRCDFTIDRIRAVRTKDFKYIRNFFTDRPLLQPQYRDKSQAYKDILAARDSGVVFGSEWMSTVRPPEELYDLRNDPFELDNLADNPNYTDKLVEFRRILEQWILETNDQGQYPESEEELSIVYERWGERCVNPEYDFLKKK